MAATRSLSLGSDTEPRMNTYKMLIDVVLAAFVAGLLTACPDDKSAEETGPASSLGETSGSHASGETGGEMSEPVRPEAMPLLCSIDGGKWCTDVCPQLYAGPLCCVSDWCYPAGLTCDGVVGWCNNYSLTADPKAVEIVINPATCHDA
jgi:hypothetical protein